jgi:hypothetical protein
MASFVMTDFMRQSCSATNSSCRILTLAPPLVRKGRRGAKLTGSRQ